MEAKDLIEEQVRKKQDSLSIDSTLLNNVDFVQRFLEGKIGIQTLELQIQTIQKVIDSVERK